MASTVVPFFLAGRRGSSKISLRPHTSRTRAGIRLHYYSCRSRYNTGPGRDCGNRKHLRAEQIEEERTEAEPDRERDAKF